MISLPTKRKFLWKQFLLVWLISTFASLLVIPYTLTLIPDASDAAGTPSQLVLTAFASNLIVYGVVSLLGLLLAARIGLGLPFLEGWLTKNPIWGRLKDVLLLAVVLGIIVGIVIIAIDTLIFAPEIASLLGEGTANGVQGTRPPPWQGLLAAISAGITEEVIFRLFAVSLLAWLGGLLFQDDEGRPRSGVMWFAIVLVSVAFGLGHLPATVAIGHPCAGPRHSPWCCPRYSLSSRRNRCVLPRSSSASGMWRKQVRYAAHSPRPSPQPGEPPGEAHPVSP